MSAAAIVQAAVVIADVVNTVVNAADRRKYQEAFAQFSNDQQNQLAAQLAAATTDIDRTNIIAQAYYNYEQSLKKNAINKQTVQYIVIVSVTLLLLGTVIIFKMSNKK